MDRWMDDWMDGFLCSYLALLQSEFKSDFVCSMGRDRISAFGWVSLSAVIPTRCRRAGSFLVRGGTSSLHKLGLRGW